MCSKFKEVHASGYQLPSPSVKKYIEQLRYDTPPESILLYKMKKDRLQQKHMVEHNGQK